MFVYSYFSLLISIPLCNIHHNLFIQQLMDTWTLSILNEAAVDIMYKSFCGHLFSFLFGL